MNTYDKMTHTHVAIRGGSFDANTPRSIVLYVPSKTGDRVWFQGSYSDDIANAVQVGDGITNGYCEDGCRVLSVPADQCWFYTDEEAEQIVAVMDADIQLIAYARG
jgi:hypothetical protein